MNAKNITWILIGLISILVILNLYSAISINSVAKDFAIEAKEFARAGEIQLITITDSACADCYEIATVLSSIKSANIEVSSEQTIEYRDEEAQALIEKYNVEKIPTVIVTGEINKEGSEITGLTAVEDALVFDNQDPVYLELATGNYRGRVQVKTITNPDCEECFDLSVLIETLKALVIVSSEETIDLQDAEEEIEAYNLEEVPAIIISGDLALYSDIADKLKELGTVVGEDIVLTAKLNPPYWDLESKESKGLVEVTYITDESCEDCYNVNVHKTVLTNYGVYTAEETTVDISSEQGQALREKYNITKVPTMIASEELQYYKTINEIWEKVGTIEDDGTYVFRDLDLVSEKYTTLE